MQLGRPGSQRSKLLAVLEAKSGATHPYIHNRPHTHTHTHTRAHTHIVCAWGHDPVLPNPSQTLALRWPCEVMRPSHTVLVSVVKGASCTHERTCSQKDCVSSQHRHIVHKLRCTELKRQTPSKRICSSKLNTTVPDLLFTAGTWTGATLNCLEIEFWHLTSIKNEWGHLIEKFKRFSFASGFFFLPSPLSEERWEALNYVVYCVYLFTGRCGGWCSVRNL